MASPLRHLRARLLRAFFRSHAAVYEWSDGWLGSSPFVPMLLLTTTGRRTGRLFTTPLVYFMDGDRYVVVASDGAARRHPQWHLNLLAHPNTTIRVGRRKLAVRASVAEGTERARLWAIGKDKNPMWDRYQARTSREIPVVVLTPER